MRVRNEKGDWKLHRHDKKSSRNTIVEKKLANYKVPQFQLFDLKKDPQEKTDVMKSNPEIGAEMKAKLAEIIKAGRTRN